MSISIKNLSFSYGVDPVFKDISLELENGKLNCVLGANGAGKTTLFRSILGLNSLSCGAVLIDGQDIRKMSCEQRAQHVAFIPQAHHMTFSFEVIDVVLMSTTSGSFMPKASHIHRAQNALETIGIQDLMYKQFDTLSGGQQQLVLVARALAQGAQNLVMDEPTSALDFGNTARILSCFRDLAHDGYCCLISTHQPEQAYLYADSIALLENAGISACGKPQDIITKQHISSMYQLDIEISSLYDDKVRSCVPTCEIESKEKRREE